MPRSPIARELRPDSMLAFIVNQFPRQVDAYFLRELRGLHESGLDFTIYSLLGAPRGWKVHEEARPLLERTVYPPSTGKLFGTSLSQLARHPGRTTKIATDIGNTLAACLVLTAAYARITGVVGIDALVDGLKEAVPSYRRQHIETNERALRAGWDAVTAGAAPIWEDAA